MYDMEVFEGFEVYKSDNKHVFIKIGELDFEKYDGIFDWAFSDEMILRYIDFEEGCSEEDLDQIKRVAIYKALKKFIDKESIGKFPYDTKYDTIYDVLLDEGLIEIEDTQLKLRKDKIGKIGEFIFYNVLADYFKFNCIFNKLHLLTNFDMSVYGMDQLFYSSQKKMLMFGESKVCKSLKNGISLINASLLEYEDRLNSEFQLVLSNEAYRYKINLPDELKYASRKTYTFDEFVNLTKITTIGIPAFIIHGTEEDKDVIMKKLDSIKPITIKGLNIEYIFISIPIKSKEQFVARITHKIDERMNK